MADKPNRPSISDIFRRHTDHILAAWQAEFSRALEFISTDLTDSDREWMSDHGMTWKDSA